MLLIARDHLAGGDATRPDGTRDVAIGELLADIEQRCFRLGTARPRALADLEGAVTLCATVPMGQVPTPGMFTPPSPGTFALAPPIPGTFGAFGASPGIPGTAPSQLSR